MRVAVTGSTGLIGTAVTRFLRDAGHEVTRVVRSYSGLPPHERAVVWHPTEGKVEAAGLEGHDVAIHLAAESVAGVWTSGKKRRIRESRVRGTALFARTLAGLKTPPRTLFSASGIHVYGNRPPDELIDEDSRPGSGFLAELVRDWEAATSPARDAGIRVVHTRFGNVMSPDGGILAVLLPLVKLGLGATFGAGDQYWPWIAIDDIPPAMLHVLERPEIAGPVNFVAPEQVTQAQFTHALAAAVHRPAFLRMPAFAARLAPGHMGDEVLLSGARVVPRKLMDSGYDFRFATLRGALATLLADGARDTGAGSRSG